MRETSPSLREPAGSPGRQTDRGAHKFCACGLWGAPPESLLRAGCGTLALGESGRWVRDSGKGSQT